MLTEHEFREFINEVGFEIDMLEGNFDRDIKYDNSRLV